jgi:hypothetical protein
MAEYPGPGGLATYWLGIDEPAHQLKRARQAFHSQAAHPQTTDGSPPPLLSADLACDYYAPWRKPTKIVLYGTTIHSLRDSGFAEVRSAEASLELRVCKDPTISAMAGHWETSGIDHASAFVENELVDPLLAAWDMKRTLGTDVPEALEKVRSRALRMAKWY